jgi:hypothetical protein
MLDKIIKPSFRNAVGCAMVVDLSFRGKAIPSAKVLKGISAHTIWLNHVVHVSAAKSWMICPHLRYDDGNLLLVPLMLKAPVEFLMKCLAAH